jgi:ribonuclease HI
MSEIKQSSKTKSFVFTLIRSTEKAYLVKRDKTEFWIPKSQIKNEVYKSGNSILNGQRIELELPDWLIDQHNSFKYVKKGDVVKPVQKKTIIKKQPSMIDSEEMCGFFDGSIEINPCGKIGYGAFIIQDGVIIDEIYYSAPAHPNNTNNVAEYMGLIELLKMIRRNEIGSEITIHGDNSMVINQMNSNKLNPKYIGNYKNFAYSAKALEKNISEEEEIKIKYKWIPREENEYADSLSKKYRSITP